MNGRTHDHLGQRSVTLEKQPTNTDVSIVVSESERIGLIKTKHPIRVQPFPPPCLRGITSLHSTAAHFRRLPVLVTGGGLRVSPYKSERCSVAP